MLSLRDAACSEIGTGTRSDLCHYRWLVHCAETGTGIRSGLDKFLLFNLLKVHFPLGLSHLHHYQYYLPIKVDQEKERERERLDERRGRREVEIIQENISIAGINFLLGEGEKH